VDRAVDDALTTTGFQVVNLSPEFTKKWDQAQKDAATVAAVGAWKFDKKLQGESEVTIRTKAVIAKGGSDYPKAYREALRRQSAWKADLDRIFQQVDFIALPTLKNVPLHMPLFGGTIAFELRALALQNTQAVNFAGVPALAMPIPIAHAPVRFTSLQLIGRHMAEAQLLNAGRLVEAAVKKQ
jgi:amidase